MRINKLNLQFSEKEISALTEKIMPKSDNFRNIKLLLKNGYIKILGEIKKIFTIKFEVTLLISSNRNFVRFNFDKVKALGPIGDMFKENIIKLIMEKLPPDIGASSESSNIYIDVNKMLKVKKIDAEIDNVDFSIRDKAVSLSVSGDFALIFFLGK